MVGAWRARMDNAKMQWKIARKKWKLSWREGDLTLCGVTAVRINCKMVYPNALQVFVAGIKVWMLTGDKVDTAINIGYACQLIAPTCVCGAYSKGQ